MGSSYLAVKLGGTALGPITFVAIRLAFAVAFLAAVAVVMRHPLPALRDEPLRIDRLAGIGLGLVGVATVVGGGLDAGGDPMAMLAILTAAGSYALHAVYSRRFLSGIEPMTVVLVQALVGAVVALGLAVAIEQPAFVMPPTETLGAAVYLGVASSGVAALAFFRLIASWGPAERRWSAISSRSSGSSPVRSCSESGQTRPCSPAEPSSSPAWRSPVGPVISSSAGPCWRVSRSSSRPPPDAGCTSPTRA